MKPVVPPGMQIHIIQQHIDDAIDQLREIVNNPWACEQLAALAIKRASRIGLDDYGDASFQKTPRQLYADTDEELADAIVYTAIAAWKTRSIQQKH